MTTSEFEKVDDALFSRYVAAFGMFDTFCAPRLTALELEGLMKKALREGKPIPYEEEGWEDPPVDVVV